MRIGGRTAGLFRLTLRVHLDAFCSKPLGYLQAVGWRLRGLRLRSRNRMAALAGHSPDAYRLWIAKHETSIRAAFASPARVDEPTILLAIDCVGRCEGVDRTLQSIASLRESSTVVIVGDAHTEGQRRVGHPRELKPFLEGEEAWLCVLPAGDELDCEALAAYRHAIARASAASLIYADDDLISTDGSRVSPHFKPSWNAELFAHHDYISGSAMLRVSREDIHALDDPNWSVQLVRKALERGKPAHLPLVLHHRRSRPDPELPSTAVAVTRHPLPSMTAIIPTRNQCGLLRTCMQGLAKTDYPAVEIVVVDNGSDDRDTLAYLDDLRQAGTKVLLQPGPFNFSALNNAAVRETDSEILCFLNNDVEMLGPNWLLPLVAQAIRKEIGAVGPQLIYADETIQHAGVFTGIGGGAAHAHRFQKPGACLVVERKKFAAVRGFDEIDFPVAFNDVDLCLKLNRRGWQSFYEPRSRLIHHESKSRGSDRARMNRDRFAGELAALKRKWSTDRECDPFHHPFLSPFCEQFCVGI
jgi:GT2 family glycosyltransferase